MTAWMSLGGAGPTEIAPISIRTGPTLVLSRL
jgi:hypothetical protein